MKSRNCLAALLLAAGMTCQVASAQESAALIRKLVEKKILTEQEGDELSAEMAAEFGASPQGKFDGGKLASKINLFADLRTRYEYTDSQNAYDQYDGDHTYRYKQDGSVIYKDKTLYPDGRPDRSDRSRFRYRLRVGVKATFENNLEFGFRLASGNAAEEVTSTNETFGDAFGKDGIYIDQAYAKWNPTPWLQLTAGKFDYTISKPDPIFWTSDMYWDTDVSVEGFAQNLKYTRGSWTAFLNLGQFAFGDVNEADEDEITGTNGKNYTWLDTDSSVDSDGDGNKTNDRNKKLKNYHNGSVATVNNDGWLFAQQLGFRYTWEPERLDAAIAFGYWYWANSGDLGAAGSSQRTASTGIVYTDPGQDGKGNNLGNEFEIFDIITEVNWKPSSGWFKDINLKPYAHLIWNLAPAPNLGVLRLADDKTADAVVNGDDTKRFNGQLYQTKTHWVDISDNFAWRVGLKLGDAKKQGQWEAHGWYEQVGSDAVPDAFNDSDISNGFTNHKGFGFKAGYALKDWWMINVAYLDFNWLDPDINQDINRNTATQARTIQLDSTWKF